MSDWLDVPDDISVLPYMGRTELNVWTTMAIQLSTVREEWEDKPWGRSKTTYAHMAFEDERGVPTEWKEDEIPFWAVKNLKSFLKQLPRKDNYRFQYRRVQFKQRTLDGAIRMCNAAEFRSMM